MSYQLNAQAIARRRQGLRMVGASKYQRAASRKKTRRQSFKTPVWFGDVIAVITLYVVAMATLYF